MTDYSKFDSPTKAEMAERVALALEFLKAGPASTEEVRAALRLTTAQAWRVLTTLRTKGVLQSKKSDPRVRYSMLIWRIKPCQVGQD